MMWRVIWFLVGFLISAVPMLAFADEYPAVYGYKGQVGYWSGKDNVPYPSAGAACTSKGDYSVGSCEVRSSDAWMICQCTKNSVNYAAVFQVLFCPAGGSLSQGICKNAPPCAEGETRNPETGQCQSDDPCKDKGGQSETVSVYMGYASTTGSNATLIDPRSPTSGCFGGCQLSLNSNVNPGSCEIIATGQAPYPVRCEKDGVYTSFQCSPSDNDGQSQPPPRDCPSGTTRGEVNGVSGCYKNYESEKTETTTNNPDGSTTKETTTKNPDGSTTKTTETTNSDGSKTTKKETITSSPPSGDPIPGGGSGGGSGSPGGGSSGGNGGSGGGFGVGVPSDKGDTEQANFCRDNPTSVMCKDKVEIDETGTDEEHDWTATNNSLKEQYDDITSSIQGSSWHQTNLGFTWNLPDRIPSGSCSPVSFGSYSLDICPTLEKARALWSWVIGILGALAIWIRGTRILAEV